MISATPSGAMFSACSSKRLNVARLNTWVRPSSIAAWLASSSLSRKVLISF